MLQYCIKQIQTNINKDILRFVNEIERQAIFFIFNTNPRFPPFLLYVKCQSGVTFIRRSFRDDFICVFLKPCISI